MDVGGKGGKEEREGINTPVLPDTLAVPTQHPLSALCPDEDKDKPSFIKTQEGLLAHHFGQNAQTLLRPMRSSHEVEVSRLRGNKKSLGLPSVKRQKGYGFFWVREFLTGFFLFSFLTRDRRNETWPPHDLRAVSSQL